jgi:hypothetical protein
MPGDDIVPVSGGDRPRPDLLDDLRSTRHGGEAMSMFSSSSRARPGRGVVILAVVVLALVGAAVFAFAGPGADIAFEGPDDEVVNAEGLEQLAFVASTDDDVVFEEAVVRHDGDDVTDEARVDGSTLRYEPGELDDGEHEVAVAVSGDFGSAEETWSFTVDATPPTLELTNPEGGVLVGQQATSVAGTTDPGTTVTVDEEEADVADDGSFEVEYEGQDGDTLTVAAVDEAGNEAVEQHELTVIPSRVDVDRVRAVHVTAHAWSSDTFRERIIAMIDDGIINTVALTLKDESGEVGWNSDVELAEASGANSGIYDLDEVVADLHDRDVHIAGRIVAFRDGTLGQYALDEGHDDWLIQTPGGDYYTSGGYGCCFTSFASPDVMDYNIDLAEEAAAAGVDSILWDYIRRPDGDPEAMVVPGLSGDADGATLEEAVVDFAAAADERLARYGIEHGASLYGIAADRPTQIAQDVPALSEHLDYVAPMIYPSHWGPGEYGVDDPNRQPYDIITATLDVWKEQVEGTRSRLVPWLEDTVYRAWDRPHQVREQIRAARDQDIPEFIMWDPNVGYTVDAYDPDVDTEDVEADEE